MLKFAAEETGTEFEAVETGIKRMQRAIIASQRGSGHLPWLRELVNLKPEEQLERVADRIAAIPNPAQRAAVAMELFGRGGTAMLPMLAGGAKGLAQWRKEAEEMGRIKTKEQAEQATLLNLAFKRLVGTATVFRNVFGAALAPVLRNVLGIMIQYIKQATLWVKEHKALVVYAFSFGAALTGIGVAAIVVGKVIGVLAGVFGMIRAALLSVSVLSYAVTVPWAMMKAIGSVLGGVIHVLTFGLGLFGVVTWAAKAAMWALNVTLRLVGIGFDVLENAVRMAVGAIQMMWSFSQGLASVLVGGVSMAVNLLAGGVAGLTTAMTGLGIVTNVLAIGIFGGLLVGALALVAKGMEIVAGGVSQGAHAAAEGLHKLPAAAAQAVEGAKNLVGGMKQGAEGWGEAIVGTFDKVRARVGQVFGRLRDDAMVGWGHLVADGQGAWVSLQESIQAGDLAGAFGVALGFAKLEFFRFKNWLLNYWEEIKPSVMSAVSTIVDKSMDAITSLRVSLRNLFDSMIDKVFDVINKIIDLLNEIQMKADTVKAAAGGFVQGLKKGGHYVATGLLGPAGYMATSDWGEGGPSNERSAPLTPHVYRDRETPEQKKAAEAAIKAQGETVKKGIKDAIGAGPADAKGAAAASERERKAREDEIRAAEAGLKAAEAEAKARAADARKKQEDELKKLQQQAGGGKGGGLDAAMGGKGNVVSTFSASAASMMGVSGGPLYRISDHTRDSRDHLKVIRQKFQHHFQYTGTDPLGMQP